MSETTETRIEPPSTSIGRVEIVISSLLRIGIYVSLTIVTVGVLMMFVHHPEYAQSSDALAPLRKGDNVFPTTLSDVFRGALEGQGRSIVLLGVFALFLTPVLRVVTSIIAFLLERDWAFALITSCVLLFLMLSLVLGKSG